MTGHIVVGVDEFLGAAAALRWAVREARLDDTTVLAVLAWSWIDRQPTADFDPHYRGSPSGESGSLSERRWRRVQRRAR